MTIYEDTASRRRGRGSDDLAASARRTSPRVLKIADRDLFLDTLAETCSVVAAATRTGRGTNVFYGLRRRDPLFAERWIAALAIGYETVEARLIDYAMGRSSGAIVDADATAPPMSIPGTGLASGRAPAMGGVPPDIQVGLLLLAQHRGTLAGGKPMRRGRRVVTAAETDAVLNKRLDQLARSLGQTRP